MLWEVRVLGWLRNLPRLALARSNLCLPVPCRALPAQLPHPQPALRSHPEYGALAARTEEPGLPR